MKDSTFRNDRLRASFVSRIGVLFFALMLVLIILLSALLSTYFHTDVENSLLASYALTVNSGAQALDDLIGRLDLYMNLITEDKADFLYTLRSYDGNIFVAYQQFLRMKEMLGNTLNVTFGSVVPDCSVCFIVDESMLFSKIISRYPLSNFNMTPVSTCVHITQPSPYVNEEWFIHMLEKPDEDHWFIQSANPDVLNVARVLKTTDIYQGSVVRYTMGCVVISFKAVWLDYALVAGSDTKLSSFLTDKDGTVLLCSDSSCLGKPVDDIIPDHGGGARTVNYNGQRCFVWENTLRSGMTLTTLLPCIEIDALLRGSIRIVAVIALALTVIGFTLILALSHYTTRPIRHLAQHMHQKTMQPTACQEKYPTREVYWLYQSFNELTGYTTQLIDDIHQAERDRRETEMQLLMAQINPHFLCNALDSVCCRALIRGDDDLATILGGLSDIMRYKLRNPGQLISLAEEMDIVHRYIAIQQMRSSASIIVTEDIDEDCLRACLPKLLVQPIVENAVIHTDRPDSITVSAIHEGNQLIIRVLNHTPGPTAEQIMAHLKEEITLTSHSTGLGVRNTNKRLCLLYSEPYGLTFSDLTDGFIEARLVLPYKGEEKT